ncbi:hypothetical protein ABT392_04200 [Paucibacter sp. JuS9]|uniref:hypothetical protein n=1 Tax=Paucibacter sp. JuS9 TaxID=3228748 RepID=UPI0037577E34
MLVLVDGISHVSGRSSYLEYALAVVSCGRIIRRQEVTSPVLSLPVDAQSTEIEEGHLSFVAAVNLKASMRNRHPRRRRSGLPTNEWSQAPPSGARH